MGPWSNILSRHKLSRRVTVRINSRMGSRRSAAFSNCTSKANHDFDVTRGRLQWLRALLVHFSSLGSTSAGEKGSMARIKTFVTLPTPIATV